jgi:hypothetical protein
MRGELGELSVSGAGARLRKNLVLIDALAVLKDRRP